MMMIFGSCSRLENLLKLTFTILLILSQTLNLEARHQRNTCGVQRASRSFAFKTRTSQLIRSRGFLAEDHYVKVHNGKYTLNLVKATNALLRDSNGEPARGLPAKDPLLFVHGMLSGANCFLVASGDRCGPKDYTNLNLNATSNEELERLLEHDGCSKSLAYTALNFGHEVWLLNRRAASDTVGSSIAHGNPRLYDNLSDDDDDDNAIGDLEDDDDDDKHNYYYQDEYYCRDDRDDLMERDAVKLIESYKLFAQQTYWNYSLDHQAEHDLPEVIDYILAKSNRSKLAVVGYSAGGAITLMSMTIKPELDKKISKVILWAPSLDLGSTQLPPFFKGIIQLLTGLRANMAPFPSPLAVAGMNLDVSLRCAMSESVARRACYPVMDPFVGKGSDQLMVDKFTVMNGIFQSSSWSEIIQLTQSIASKTMHYYDYIDPELNNKAYGRPKPPEYDISKIKSQNIHIFGGNTDRLVNHRDLDTTEKRLSVPVKRYTIGDSGVFFNHYAFIVHKQNVKLLIVPCLKIIA